jgi:D-3-phosphoglycerate dehydrogenase
VATTCIQLIRDIDQWRSVFEAAGLDLVVPDVPGQHLEGDALVDALDGCVGVVAGDDKFTRSVLDRLPELRVISKWGIGVDGIDHDAARDHGITIRNTPGMFDDEVADVTMAYVVVLARHLAVIDRGVRSGSWPKPAGRSLRGSTLGVVGLGGIGRAVAVRAVTAGMNLLGTDPSPESQDAARTIGVEIVDADELFRRSEFISVNCPLTPATHHLLDGAAFELMKPGVRIVNTGRGAVIETAALVAALERGVVAGAALDVMEDEPPGRGHPLTRFDQVVFGSHNASNTLEASARVHRRAIDHLVEELRGH